MFVYIFNRNYKQKIKEYFIKRKHLRSEKKWIKLKSKELFEQYLIESRDKDLTA